MSGATEAPREFGNRYAVSEAQVESAVSVRLLWGEFVNAIQRQGTNSRLLKEHHAMAYSMYTDKPLN